MPMRFLSHGLRLLVVVLLLMRPAWGHQGRPALLRDVGIDQHLNQQIPLALTFLDEAGDAVQLGDYFTGKPVILVLSYYQCPRLCPMVLDGLVRSLRTLTLTAGKEFRVLTVSIDARDTPADATAKKAQYVRQYGRAEAADGWHFLTGAPGAIEPLARAVGFRYVYDAEQDQFAHAAGIMVLTPSGKLSRYFYGLEYAPRDLRLSLVEASANKIGSPIDQLLLFCFHYDPATGKYGLVIMNVLRLAGLATVVGLGACIGIMFWRDRRQKNGPSE